jgi:ubiquinone/menaquinone biosynthesis C-methylase UbiE
MHGHSPARHLPTAGKVLHWAPFYDKAAFVLTLGQEKRIRQETVDFAGIQPGHSVLDVGCGTGSLTLAARKAAGDGMVAGIDPSPEMIETARKKATGAGAGIDFREGVIEDLPFPDETFDVVLSSLMLHHLPEEVKQQGLLEVLRVLKPGGRFLAVDLAAPGHSLLGHVTAFLHKRPADLSPEMPVLRDAGFQDISTGPMRFRLLGYVSGRKSLHTAETRGVSPSA